MDKASHAHSDTSSCCDLRAITDVDGAIDQWSIEQHEARHPHYRYEIVCVKLGFTSSLGQGFSYREARYIVSTLNRACQTARPKEDTWTRPLFLLQRITPTIGQGGSIGDVVFVQHESNFRYQANGSVSTFTRRDLLGLIASVSPSGQVHRVQPIEGEVMEEPKVACTYAAADVLMDAFLADIQTFLADRSPSQRYDFLTSRARIEELMVRHARRSVTPKPIDVGLAAHLIQTLELPLGHAIPTMDIAELQRQVIGALDQAKKDRIKVTSSPTRLAA